MVVTNESIVEVIVEYIKKHGYPPSVREIGDSVGFQSTNTTWKRLQKMLETGMIESDNPGTARAIRVPGYKLIKVEESEEKGE